MHPSFSLFTHTHTPPTTTGDNGGLSLGQRQGSNSSKGSSASGKYTLPYPYDPFQSYFLGEVRRAVEEFYIALV